MASGRYDHSYQVTIGWRKVHYAFCVYCSFEGPERRTKEQAEKDMDEHVGGPEHQRRVRGNPSTGGDTE